MLNDDDMIVWVGESGEVEEGLASSLRHIGASRERVRVFKDPKSKEDLLEKYFIPRVVKAYRLLSTYGTSQAESLFKFCVLYKYGGVYVAPGVTLSGPVISGASTYPRNSAVPESNLVAGAVDSFFIYASSKRNSVMKEAIEYIVGNIYSVLESSAVVESKLGEIVRTAPKWTILRCSSWDEEFTTIGRECHGPNSAPDSAPVLLAQNPRAFHSVSNKGKRRSEFPPYGVVEPIDAIYNSRTPVKGLSDQYVPSSVLAGDKCNRCLMKSKGGGTCKLCFESCKIFCSTLCDLADARQLVQIDVVPNAEAEEVTSIPRIVHQSWKSFGRDGSKMRKMQAGWRRTG